MAWDSPPRRRRVESWSDLLLVALFDLLWTLIDLLLVTLFDFLAGLPPAKLSCLPRAELGHDYLVATRGAGRTCETGGRNQRKL